MGEPVAATATQAAPPRPKSKAWDQQPGENDLWYARFIRFVALGPGRSVSLVATGRRNAYPVPAHWPIQAKQRQWRERATAFDQAARKDDKVIVAFNMNVVAIATLPGIKDEKNNLRGIVYVLPPEDDFDEPAPSTND